MPQTHLVPSIEGCLALGSAGGSQHHRRAVSSGAGQGLEFNLPNPRLKLPGAQQEAPGSSLKPLGALPS